MWRFISGVILAPVFWGLLQFPGNLLLFNLYPEAANGSATPSSYLILALLFAFVYALFSGFCSAWVAATDPRKIGVAAGLLLLIVGIAVQLSFWELLPVWWHLIFLASIVPLTMLGARLKGAPASA